MRPTFTTPTKVHRSRNCENGGATLFILLMAAALMILLSVAARGWSALHGENRRFEDDLRRRAAALRVETVSPKSTLGERR